MSIIFFLIIISVIVAGGFLFVFFWAANNGQFDDMYTPSVRMLFDEAELKIQHPKEQITTEPAKEDEDSPPKPPNT